MKQILQDLSTGATTVAEIPYPTCPRRYVNIRARTSLISLGTERMLVGFGKANPLQKARQQPDKVRMVLDKARTDGVGATLDAVKSKLAQPLAMGYCSAGVVIESVDSEFAIGDRVVSNGPHAEVVCVPRNLVARIPDGVSMEAASFAPVGAIGLQGIRLAAPALGETVVVIGLGLIGLLSVQLLRAQGCHVIGVDFDAAKATLAERYGASAIVLKEGMDPVREVLARAAVDGVDAVLITASTKSSDPVRQAAGMCRKRGRIVLVGVTGLELSRSDFYEKELSFQVSCSYGPGRYDPFYEEQGNDYPVGFVRWTAQRNFDAVLQLMADGRLDVDALISERYDLADAQKAYEEVASSTTALGIIIDYDQEEGEHLRDRQVPVSPTRTTAALSGKVGVAFVGAGNYASRILIPAFRAAGADLRQIVSQKGVSAAHHGKALGFASASTDIDSVLADDSVDVVVVATRHDTHAEYAARALEAGKQVFVEKPMALTEAELQRVVDSAGKAETLPGNCLMVGFNRRFAPHVMDVKALLAGRAEPKSFIFTMNAGHIPADSWVQSAEKGGGRVIGEACHYIDLMRHLAGCPITSVEARSMGRNDAFEIVEDKCVITLGFEDGSIGTIQYFANGGSRFPKERIEVFANDAVLQIDNFRALRAFGWQGAKGRKLFKQDKGQEACVQHYLDSVAAGKGATIAFDELVEVSRATLEADRLIRSWL